MITLHSSLHHALLYYPIRLPSSLEPLSRLMILDLRRKPPLLT